MVLYFQFFNLIIYVLLTDIPRIYLEQQVRDTCKGQQSPFLPKGYTRNYGLNIFDGILEIFSVPAYLFFLIIGFPLYQINPETYNLRILDVISQRIEQQIFKSSNSKSSQITSFLYYLNTHKDQFQSLLNFKISEDEEILNLIKQIYNGQLNLNLPELDKESIKRLLQNKVYDLVIQNVKNHLISLDISDEIISSFEIIYQSQIAMHRLKEMREYNEFDSQKYSQIALDYLKESNCTKFYELLELIMREFNSGAHSTDQKRIEIELRSPGAQYQAKMFNRLPQSERVNVNGQSVYREKDPIQLNITSSFYGWRVALFFIQVFFTTVNIMKLLYYLAFYSEFGFKMALYSEVFDSSFIIDKQTGEMVGDKKRIQTPMTLAYRQIKRDCENQIRIFEESPDNGILGKSITRVFNRIEHRIINHFIVGFIICNILLRIWYFMQSVLFVILIPMSILIGPILRILITIRNLLFYDVITEGYHGKWNLPKFAPIFNVLIWRLFGRGIGQIIASIFYIFFLFFFGLLEIAWSLFLYLLRKAIDVIVFVLINCCGRVPIGDSEITWRTKRVENEAPEVTFQQDPQEQLTQEQISVLVDTEFDKCVLKVYRASMIEKIKDPVVENDEKIKSLFSNFFLQNPSNQTSVSSQYHAAVNNMIEKLDKQIQEKTNQLPSVKRSTKNFIYAYTKGQVQEITLSTTKYIKEKYSENQLFHNIMWNEFNCEVGDYNQMYLIMFNRIFFKGIHLPLNVLEKLTYSEPPSSEKNINIQIDSFLMKKYGIKGKLKNPLSFLQFSTFINKVNSSQQYQKRIVNFTLEEEEPINFNELILLNIKPHIPQGESLL